MKSSVSYLRMAARRSLFDNPGRLALGTRFHSQTGKCDLALTSKSLFRNILRISPYSSKIWRVVWPQPHDSKRSRGEGGTHEYLKVNTREQRPMALAFPVTLQFVKHAKRAATHALQSICAPTHRHPGSAFYRPRVCRTLPATI